MVGLKASQSDLVQDFFVRTADDNYTTARWCAVHDLSLDFLWLSVHALEKYMKAALLLNGGTSKNFSHDIIKLYTQVSGLAPELLPDKLLQPEKLIIRQWSDTTPIDFLARLYGSGNANNRYGLYGFEMRSEYLFKLDTMVFAVRRLICRLEERFPSPDVEGANSRTRREILARQPDYFFSGSMPLDMLIGAAASEKKHALLNMNFAFAPSDYPHTPTPDGWLIRNAAIYRRVIEPLRSNKEESIREAAEVWKWVKDNIKIPADASASIEEEVSKALTDLNAREEPT